AGLERVANKRAASICSEHSGGRIHVCLCARECTERERGGPSEQGKLERDAEQKANTYTCPRGRGRASDAHPCTADTILAGSPERDLGFADQPARRGPAQPPTSKGAQHDSEAHGHFEPKIINNIPYP